MPKDTKFQPGQSGNPAGKPKGAKDKRTQYRELLEPHANELFKKVVDMAKEGDTTCLKICIDRLLAPYRARDAAVTIGDLSGTLTEQGQKIIVAMGEGRLAPLEASSMLSAIASQCRIEEIDELEKRIRALEEAHGVKEQG